MCRSGLWQRAIRYSGASMPAGPATQIIYFSSRMSSPSVGRMRGIFQNSPPGTAKDISPYVRICFHPVRREGNLSDHRRWRSSHFARPKLKVTPNCPFKMFRTGSRFLFESCLARRRLRPARRIRQFDRDGCRTAGFSRLARILERQVQPEVNGVTPE
jgi:hypothetical protein